MIYFVYDNKDLIAETDSLDFVKLVARRHPLCIIKELGTGKTYRVKRRQASPNASALSPGNTVPA